MSLRSKQIWRLHNNLNKFVWNIMSQITRVRNTIQTRGLDRVLIYLSSITCQFLYFIQWMVFDFYFDGVTLKTGNRISSTDPKVGTALFSIINSAKGKCLSILLFSFEMSDFRISTTDIKVRNALYEIINSTKYQLRSIALI